ncbi:hypothetical protein SEA_PHRAPPUCCINO_69 [Mycobacterium phage Phrappuccino]|uniref:Uncharacterized protein n=1 Tax=Mycobacterium phage Phrappuccino TaxID=2591223 RepID=A0A514DDR1_9CAUD|nr:hypothetical protein KHQ87_gp069 [Mycobacterium phage Phrappuccino]QDH91744.1 hypothetical protein SEA_PHRAPPUCCINO_69 [Mycobacterium phage Phrappuccino]QIQ63186.1 hypothetical protein SEA_SETTECANDELA_69 [Mycobacterium phage Settecandela]
MGAAVSIKLPEDFGVNQLRKDVRDSLQTAGEQCIVLAMRHPVDDDDAEKCPVCDDDIYNDGEADCEVCYGTRYAHPVREAAKVWAVFSDQTNDETYTKQGVFQSDVREIQTEAFPRLMEHDYVVRVRRWTPDGRAAEIEGFYTVDKVIPNSVRTGNRFGQASWDIVGQKATVREVPRTSLAITKYPVLGKTFNAGLIEPVGTMATPAPAPPDTKVVYVPVISPGASTPDPDDSPPLVQMPPGTYWRRVFFHTQSAPAATWTIVHPFDYDPSVTLFVGGEEADTDVEYPNDHTVVLTFAEPQAGVAQLI